jgi:hypothetical protein
MSTYNFTCPIDGLELTSCNPSCVPLGSGDVAGDAIAAPGAHVHEITDVTASCANGHQWHMVGEVLISRVE